MLDFALETMASVSVFGLTFLFLISIIAMVIALRGLLCGSRDQVVLLPDTMESLNFLIKKHKDGKIG